MANIDASFGLKPYSMLGSGANTNGTTTYTIQSASVAGSASVIYQGSPVIPLANGLVDIVGAAAGGTVPLLGALVAVNYIALDGTPKFDNKWPGTAAVKANTVATVTVAAHPDQLFTINCNAAAADSLIHNNANFATATSGNATTGLSTAELDVSTANTTNSLNLRIVGFEDLPSSSDVSVAGRVAIVMLNNHFYRYGANGTGAGV